jgi:ABC-type anion transport system duplicated permease subunit
MDPLTIYAGAQATIAGIKSAIAMGKDINSLMGDVSKFFGMAEQVHIGATKKKIESIKKSDSQIASEALQIAWASKKLREDERYLKDMLIWSGNDDVYYEMIQERTRLAKERAEEERKEEERIQKHREMVGELVMNILLFIAALACLIPIGALLWQFLLVR